MDTPYCYNGGDPADWHNTVYPENDGGQDNAICDGSFPTTLMHLSIRLHLGKAWDNGASMNPCVGNCFAYKLSGITYEDPNCTSNCTVRLDVADVSVDSSLLNQSVKVHDEGGTLWTSAAIVTGVVPGNPVNGQSNYLEVGPVPSGLPACAFKQFGSGYCGSAEETAYTESFTLAGGPPGNTDKSHPFYTLHRGLLEQLAAGGPDQAGAGLHPRQKCQGGGDVPDNDYVDGLP
jgi:hypothetical protein